MFLIASTYDLAFHVWIAYEVIPTSDNNPLLRSTAPKIGSRSKNHNYSRALFKGAADMQQQLTKSDEVLDPSRELAVS